MALKMLVGPESIGERIQLSLTAALKVGTHVVPILQMRKLSPGSVRVALGFEPALSDPYWPAFSFVYTLSVMCVHFIAS